MADGDDGTGGDVTAMPNLWAVAPGVLKAGEDHALHYDHANPALHRVAIQWIGGIGEGNAGEFLVETPCGYRGWVKRVNRNPDGVGACEACLNGRPSSWVRFPIPTTAVAAEQPAPISFGGSRAKDWPNTVGLP